MTGVAQVADGERPALARVRFAPATLVGFRAARMLREGAEGRLVAVVSAAAYMEMASDGRMPHNVGRVRHRGPRLLWLSGPGEAAHGRALLAPLDLAALAAGDPVRVRDGEVTIGQRARIGLAGAPVWKPPRIEARALPPDACAIDRIAEAVLVGTGAAVPAADQLATLVSRVGLPGYSLGPLLASPITPCSLADRTLALAHALVGLGPGLTPAGDDLLGGVLFAIRTAAGPDPATAAALRRAAALAHGQTNRISEALLHDYAQGEGPEPLHRLAVRCAAADEPGAVRAGSDLARIGHTTGWATLAGFLAGLRAVAQSTTSKTPRG